MSLSRRLQSLRWITGIAIAALIGGIVPAASASDTYDVYAILPLSGAAAFTGREERSALGVLQAAVNNGGGIKGHSINFVVLDSQSSPLVAVQLTNQVIAKHVPLLIGDTSTGTCSAMAPLLAHGPVQFCLSPGFRPVKGGYSYSIAPSPEILAKAAIRYFRLKGWSRVAILVATDATGQLIADEYSSAVGLPENKSLKIVSLERFNPTDISVAAQLSRIQAANAQVMVAFVSGTAFGMVLRSVRDAGMGSMPIMTSEGNLNYAAMAAVGEANIPENLLFCAGPLPSEGEPIPSGPLKASRLAYLAAFKAQGIKPDFGDAVIWDTGAVVIAALRATGVNATPEQIRAYVNALHGYPGVQGVMDFRDGAMRGLTDFSMLAWNKPRNTWNMLPDPVPAQKH